MNAIDKLRERDARIAELEAQAERAEREGKCERLCGTGIHPTAEEAAEEWEREIATRLETDGPQSPHVNCSVSSEQTYPIYACLNCQTSGRIG